MYRPRNQKSDFSLWCVTSRSHCSSQEQFKERLSFLACAGVKGIILREKDLSGERYQEAASQFLQGFSGCGAELYLNHFVDEARCVGADKIQVSFGQLREQPEIREHFTRLGVSVHAPWEARTAQELGADFLIAGHIFPTDCKRGQPARGLDFLQETAESVSIPVYAIGGINEKNLSLLPETGARGACMMSRLMTCTCREVRRIVELCSNLNL